jgi:hypothetical protein
MSMVLLMAEVYAWSNAQGINSVPCAIWSGQTLTEKELHSIGGKWDIPQRLDTVIAELTSFVVQRDFPEYPPFGLQI